MRLCFATNNPGKLAEVRALLGASVELVSLNEIGCTEELPETGTTLQDNALQKAQYVWDNYRIDCFADDTGLEVEALSGAPGVYSARYAGPGNDAGKNMQKLLDALRGNAHRAARFRTVIALIREGKPWFFEGEVAGNILTEKHGEKGFGYDPIFQPAGSEQSFAEMNAAEKNRISHRAKAIQQLVIHLLAVA